MRTTRSSARSGRTTGPSSGAYSGTRRASVTIPDGPARPLLFDGSPLLASAVYAADGEVLVGRDAWHQARHDPARLEPNPKRRVDDGVVLHGERVVPVVDLVAAVLDRVAVEARAVLGRLPPVVLTGQCPEPVLVEPGIGDDVAVVGRGTRPRQQFVDARHRRTVTRPA